MATGLLPKTKIKYILSIFKQVCETAIIHDKWMTANTWADTICLHYHLSKGIVFDGTALSRAIAPNIGLCLAMDAPKDNIKTNHCGIFHDHFKPTMATAKKRCGAPRLQ